MNSHSQRYALVPAMIVVAICLAAFPVFAQSTQDTKNTADQTLRSAGRVNPSSLGMELDIPLGGYQGRGAINLPLGLSYSSKLWRFEQYASISQTNRTSQVYVTPKFSEETASGWSSSLQQAYIDYTGERTPYEGTGRPLQDYYGQGGQTPSGVAFVKRINVVLPGGGSHVLIADFEPVASSTGSPASDFWDDTFLATDGSGLRYVEDSTASPAVYRLYLPDGSYYDFGSSRDTVDDHTRMATRLTDVHGNYVQFTAATTGYPNGYWTDQIGRIFPVVVPRRMPSLGSGTVLEQEFEFPGMTQRYILRWKKLKGANAGESAFTDFDNQELHYDGHRNFAGTTYSPSLFFTSGSSDPCGVNTFNVLTSSTDKFNPVLLTEIELPNGALYKFSYNEFGELEVIHYPSGGREEIVYGQVTSLAELAPAYRISNRGVMSRSVYESDSDSTPDTWTFSAAASKNIYRTSVIAPDDTQIDRFMHRGVPEPSCNSQIDTIAALNGYWPKWGYDNPLSGMQFEERVFDSNGDIVKRALTKWTTSASTTEMTAYPQRYVQFNARTLSTETIVYDGDNGLSSAATIAYDTDDDDLGSPLNVVSQTEYAFKAVTGGNGFSPATSAPDDGPPSISDPTSGTTALRTTETVFLQSDSAYTSVKASYLARNLVKLPTQVIIKDPSNSSVKSKSEITYDQSTYLVTDTPGGTVPGWSNPNSSVRGLPTTSKAWYDIANNLSIQTHVQYNQFGSVRKTWDGNNNVTETQYDDNYDDSTERYSYAFPTLTISPVPGGNGSTTSLQTSIKYDFDTGLPVSSTDPNGLTTVMEYDDPLLRPTRTAAYSGSTQVGAATETEYGAGTSPPTRWVKTRTQIDETHWKEAYAWYDGLGRATRSQTVDPDGDIVVDTEYDVMSRPFKVTNPYRLDTSSPFGPAETVYWTERVFDAAGRPWKTITSDDAVVETTYSLSTSGTLGTAVTVEDQADKLRRSITNSLGHLVRVDEPNNSGLGSIASPNQPTPYTYDLLNNLTQVAQAGDSNDECGPSTTTCSQTRTFTYDALSRLKQAVNPESGTINYTYDANGNIATKTDARGIVTTYTYDTLNRVTQRAYATPSPTPSNYSATPTVNYYYDNLTNATGKLIKVESSVSTTEYSSFDILGRVTASKQTTDGVTYGDGTATSAMTYSYNLSGALIEQQYPSGQKVKNTIDSNGDLAMVQSRKNSAAGYWSYANSFSYNAAGAVTSMQLGNGRWESMTFNERLQPTQIALGTTPNAVNLLDLGYTYGTTANNGNVLTQTITVPTVGANTGFTAVQTYNYDPVNRLKDATEMITPHGGSQTQSWKQVFSFDRYGNRNFVTGSGQTTTLGSCPTAVCNPSIDPSNNRLTASTYGYNFDSAGNTTRDASDRKFTYDGENKQTKVESLTTGTNSVTGTVGEYFYDGDGKRVKKYVPKPDPEPDEVTIFVYDAAGKLIEEFSSDVASSTEAQVAYVTHDSLGSRRINTNENGAVTSRLDYYPFGEEIPGDGISARAAGLEYQNDSIRRRFSGKERDDETSLDYFLARYYSPVLGRFASADPILVSTKQVIHPQTWNLYNYVNNNPLAYVDPTGMERIRLGQHTDDEINERTNAIEREKQGIQNDASLSEEDKQSKMAVLDAEATNLQMEKIANNAVSSYLAALDLVGERQGLKVSDFTLSTDSKNDFASVPGAGDPGKGATFFMVLGHSNEIFINQNSQIYQASLGNVTRLDGDGKQIPTADLNIYMGAAGIHERSHRDSPTRDLQKSEGRAYTEQLRVLQKFGPNAFVSKDFFYQAAGFIMNGTERP